MKASPKSTPLTFRLARVICILAVGVLATNNVLAKVNTLKEALDTALKHKEIEDSVEKVKLHALAAHYNGDNKRWRFQLYDGGEQLHYISVDSSGKVRHYKRDLSGFQIFDDVDFSKIPPPSDVIAHDLIKSSKAALEALQFKVVDNGKIYLNYAVRSELKKKDTPYHAWSVTLPIGDGKVAKSVVHKNGVIEEIRNAIIAGS